MCKKGKSLKQKKKYTSVILMSYMGTLWHDLAKLEQEEKETQRKLFKTDHLIISLFSLFLIPRFRGNLASISL